MQTRTPHTAANALTIPNLITLGRFVLVPVIIYLMLTNQWQLAFWLFFIAGASDGIDGFIARQFDQQSTIGAYIDPIADKLLLVGVFVLLATSGSIPLWLVVLIVARDVFIVGAVLLASVVSAGLTIKPLFVSKATTAAQIALAAYIFAAKAWQFIPGIMGELLIYTTAALTLASAAAYAVVWFGHMAGYEDI
ncbi:MAG: CDP-alcohol phosphatidyltransferase family protein [Pseudomonadota bacterium]